MSRRVPNPWISIPSIALGVLAGALGWIVTDVSCRQDDPGTTCVGWAVTISLLSFVAVTIGTVMILVLVYRSIAEWREAGEAGEDPPGPG